MIVLALLLQLWTGCVPYSPIPTATGSPVATPTPVPVQMFSQTQGPSLNPWPAKFGGSMGATVLRPDLVRSVNILIDGAPLPPPFGVPPLCIYPPNPSYLGCGVFWTPTVAQVGKHTVSFVAYSDAAGTQPLNVPSATSVPPTLYNLTVGPPL